MAVGEHVELNAGEATQPNQAAGRRPVTAVKVVRLPPASPPSATDVDQPLLPQRPRYSFQHENAWFVCVLLRCLLRTCN